MFLYCFQSLVWVIGFIKNIKKKNKFVGKMRQTFYSDINENDLEKYQKYFEEALSVVNIDNLTKWSQRLKFDRDDYDKSYNALKSVWDKAEKDGLNVFNLQIMFEQYVFADVIERERYKNNWVKKVTRRNKEDFFPDAYAMWNMFKNIEKQKK